MRTVLALLWICLPAVCLAQGDTGYRELITAGNMVRENKALQAALRPGATLTDKQVANGDRDILRALERMRIALDKGVVPDQALDLTQNDMLNSLGGLRQLARALTVKHYVLAAAGRMPDALDTMRQGFRLSHALRSHSILGWLTGIAIESTLATTLVKHLDQLSAKDCERLSALAEDWTKDPNGTAEAIAREQQAGIAAFRKQMPGASKETLAKYEDGLTKAYQKAASLLKTPYAEYKPTEPLAQQILQGSDVGSALTQALAPLFDTFYEGYVRRQTMARLLGCHAAIRRYKWENGIFPNRLSVLKMGDMATDPFTNKEFVYKMANDAYTLESVGPYKRDDKGNINNEERTPVTLIPRQ